MKYQIITKLGEGAFGSVFLIKNQQEQQSFKTLKLQFFGKWTNSVKSKLDFLDCDTSDSSLDLVLKKRLIPSKCLSTAQIIKSYKQVINEIKILEKLSKFSKSDRHFIKMTNYIISDLSTAFIKNRKSNVLRKSKLLLETS